jgi:ABC-2 type transport system permease protein
VSNAALVLRQLRYENTAFWRNPASAFFTFAFPLIFMVLLNTIFGGARGPAGESAAAFFTPAIVCFSIVNACFTGLAMTVTIARDEGILKRIRGTPLPTWAYLCARILQQVLLGLLLVAIVSLFGAMAYGVPLPVGRLPELVIVLGLGAGSFAALGLGVAGLIPNASAAPAIVNALVLPLLFVSDVFINLDDGSTLAQIGDLFPIRHFADALQSVYTPTLGGALDPLDLAWVTAWGLAGAVVAWRTFSWEPHG